MKLRLLFLLAGLLVIGVSVEGADWPQFRGPNRDDVSKETGLLQRWPKDGPKLLWTYADAGIGYSGPAIIGNRLYCMGGDGTNDFVFCLDTQNGKKLWQTNIGPYFKNGYGDGPRGTPTLDGNVLFAIGGQGNVVCIETDKGKNVWQKNM